MKCVKLFIGDLCLTWRGFPFKPLDVEQQWLCNTGNHPRWKMAEELIRSLTDTVLAQTAPLRRSLGPYAWEGKDGEERILKEVIEKEKMAACEFLKMTWMHLGTGVFCIHLAAIFKRHGTAKQTSRAIFDIFVPPCSTLELSTGFLSSCNPFRSYCSVAQRWPLVSEPAAASCTGNNFGVGRRPLKNHREPKERWLTAITTIIKEPCFNKLLFLCNSPRQLYTNSNWAWHEKYIYMYIHIYFSMSCLLQAKQN